jgi:hypothetical protein
MIWYIKIDISFIDLPLKKLKENKNLKEKWAVYNSKIA